MADRENTSSLINDGADEAHAGEWKPLVKDAKKVEIKGDEEEEEIMFKMRAKLYTFVKEDVYGGEKRSNYWKERGLGDVKLLKHKTRGKVRLLMRQEKTLKICANHLISPHVSLRPNVGSDRAWVFNAMDFADEELKEEYFAIKFKTPEFAQQFFDQIEIAKKLNAEDETPAGKDEELEKTIDERNQREAERRESVAHESAKKDSDHDSDEEDIDEGNAERLKNTVGDHTAPPTPPKQKEEDAVLNDAVAKLKVGGSTETDTGSEDVKKV